MSVNTPLLINTEGGRADKTRKGTSDAMTLFNIVCTMYVGARNARLRARDASAFGG